MAAGKRGSDGPITIKKYANRRLYNTATSSYVTLEHLRDMVKEGAEFNVYDAKSGDDITRSVLAQIIFEEEGKGHNMLPISFLRQLIGFYGDRMQAFVPPYLEMSMESLAKNAETMRHSISEAFGAKLPGIPNFEDIARQNMQLFQRTLKMFSPFGVSSRSEPERPAAAAEPAPQRAAAEPDEMAELKKQIEAMRKQLDALASRGEK